MSFLKYGNDAKALLETEAKREEESFAPFRFWLKRGEKCKITFLDGELHEDGMLAIPMFYEHRVKFNGRWENFVCTGAQEPCPLCAQESGRAALVGALTIIDHRKIASKKGDKVYHMEKKLFIAKKKSIQILTELAETYGGLTGATFEVKRLDDERSFSVGDMFAFTKKHEVSFLAEKLGEEKSVPFNYSEAIVYHTAAQLAEMGVVTGIASVGGGSGGGGAKQAAQSSGDDDDFGGDSDDSVKPGKSEDLDDIL